MTAAWALKALKTALFLSYVSAITTLKLRKDEPNVFTLTCILNPKPGQKLETWVSSPYHLGSQHCSCSSCWLHRSHLNTQDFLVFRSLLTHMSLKVKIECAISRRCVSLTNPRYMTKLRQSYLYVNCHCSRRVFVSKWSNGLLNDTHGMLIYDQHVVAQ